MKNIMNSLKIKTVACILAVGLVSLHGGCGNAEQKEAYERAETMEQQLPIEKAPAIITAFEQVIRMEPGSKWAEKARTRIDSLEDRVKAEELRKSVFQEHGID